MGPVFCRNKARDGRGGDYWDNTRINMSRITNTEGVGKKLWI